MIKLKELLTEAKGKQIYSMWIGIRKENAKLRADAMNKANIEALVKDATFFRMITLKPDGMLYHTKTSSLLGRNVADVVEFVKNPLNEDLLVKILAEVESLWNN